MAEIEDPTTQKWDDPDLIRRLNHFLSSPNPQDFSALALDIFAYQFARNRPFAAFARSLNGDLKPGTLVTDVGSVKVLPHEVAGRHGVPFIGSHPMAGSEQTGIEAARADLFKGAACALTNDQERPDSELQALAAFWQNLGCSTSEMNSQDHDRAVARISHLPHAMAVATAGAALRFPGDESLAAGGFRDTTRVASGDPAMWAEIMVENRAALTAALKDAQKEIREMLDHLAKPDKKGLQNYLSEVKARKENPSENL
ncbi:prephenate dehydrogenase/arogenate dehydrogenase family protein [Akkermansiaceae bacterium]|nr:prephenate dehydrogenase/arogenate dehydrogenase family protein [Akkermansiaceae bacterium]